MCDEVLLKSNHSGLSINSSNTRSTVVAEMIGFVIRRFIFGHRFSVSNAECLVDQFHHGATHDGHNLDGEYRRVARVWNKEHDEHVLGTLMSLVEPHFEPTTWAAFRKVTVEGVAQLAADRFSERSWRDPLHPRTP